MHINTKYIKSEIFFLNFVMLLTVLNYKADEL